MSYNPQYFPFAGDNRQPFSYSEFASGREKYRIARTGRFTYLQFNFMGQWASWRGVELGSGKASPTRQGLIEMERRARG